MGFLNKSFQELKKVVWPTQKEAFKSFVTVLVVVFILFVFITIIDMGLSYLKQSGVEDLLQWWTTIWGGEQAPPTPPSPDEFMIN